MMQLMMQAVQTTLVSGYKVTLSVTGQRLNSVSFMRQLTPSIPAKYGFTLDVYQKSDDGRLAVEQFIKAGFASTYGADIDISMPYVLAINNGKFKAALGIRAATENLFIEQYLSQPIEHYVSQQQTTVAREHIAEIGHLYSNSNKFTIPLFFTQIQYDQLLFFVKPNILFSQQKIKFGEACECKYVALSTYKLVQKTQLKAPDGTAKITYTSGSTGTPKGGCLSIKNQMAVANALVASIGLQSPRHLCLLPLPTLLENIAGVYCPMLASGTVVLASDAERGFEGSRLVNPHALLSCISKTQPNSLILVPELLQVLVMATKNNWQPPASLKFIAVGGSRVSASMLADARSIGLPVYQGYGLSECSSVVSINTPHNDDVLSAGTVLEHLKVEVINDELVITGNTFLGYLEDANSWYKTQVFTGDIAKFENNKIYIQGRIKNTIINSFGRNISPEWIESELQATGLFLQSVVLGDSRPFCMAILVPISEHITEAVIQDAINKMNNQLPDYAQIKATIILTQAMGFEDGLYTANMRPRREQINQHYQAKIAAIYANHSKFVVVKEGKNTMSLYQRLLNETTTERDYLLSSPIIHRCFSGDIETADYVAFLSQAYHNVKHTVPLLMSVGSRLPQSKEWLREAVAEYIEEELGHQEWVLNDIASCGYDKEEVRATQPQWPLS